MILGYAQRNALAPKVNAAHIARFAQLARNEHPQLAAMLPHYQNVGSQIASRIEGLDADRRRMAFEDLNQNLLGHVQSALATGKTAPAVQAIRAHLEKLARQHGVPIPPGAASAPGGARPLPIAGAAGGRPAV